MNAHECIGKYSGIKIDDNEKQKILNNLPSHCEKPSVIIYILFAFSWLVIPFFAIGTSWAFVEYNQIIVGLLFCVLCVGDIVLIVYTWIVKNVYLYSCWKRECKAIKNHDVYKIKVEPATSAVCSNFYKSKGITLNINGEIYDDFFGIPDYVYEDLDNYEYYAYYFEHTKKELRSNRYIYRYGIYIITEEKNGISV